MKQNRGLQRKRRARMGAFVVQHWILMVVGLLLGQVAFAQTISELEAVSGSHASTFELLESQAEELEMAFADGTRSLASRNLDGDLDVVFGADRAPSDHTRVSLSFSPLDGMIRVSHGQEKAVSETLAGIRTPSLAWAAVQARELAFEAQKSTGVAGELAWEGTLLRYRSPGAAGDESAWPKTPWQSRLQGVEKMSFGFADVRIDVERAAPTDRVSLPGKALEERPVKPGAEIHRPELTATLRDFAGEEIGTVRWFASARVFSWHLPGITEGWVDEQRLGKSFGFDATMEWAAVQAFAFWRNAPIYRAQAGLPEDPSQPLSAFAKSGTDDGCTGLSWLNGSIFRPCCDRHDKCYEKNGCSWKSWFFLESWKCNRCNGVVVACFVTGGGVGGDDGGGGGSGGGGGGGGGGGDDPGCGGGYGNECGGDPCSTSGGGWCPPECGQCTVDPFLY